MKTGARHGEAVIRWANRGQPANSKGGNWWQSPLCGAHTDRHFRERPGFAGSPGGHGDYEAERGVGGGEGRDLGVFEAGGAAGIEDFDFTDELDAFGVDHPKRAGWLEGGFEFRDSGQRFAIRSGEEDQVRLDLSRGEFDAAQFVEEAGVVLGGEVDGECRLEPKAYCAGGGVEDP